MSLAAAASCLRAAAFSLLPVVVVGIVGGSCRSNPPASGGSSCVLAECVSGCVAAGRSGGACVSGTCTCNDAIEDAIASRGAQATDVGGLRPSDLATPAPPPGAALPASDAVADPAAPTTPRGFRSNGGSVSLKLSVDGSSQVDVPVPEADIDILLVTDQALRPLRREFTFAPGSMSRARSRFIIAFDLTGPAASGGARVNIDNLSVSWSEEGCRVGKSEGVASGWIQFRVAGDRVMGQFWVQLSCHTGAGSRTVEGGFNLPEAAEEFS